LIHFYKSNKNEVISFIRRRRERGLIEQVKVIS